jgi:hypothetical protein
VCFWSYDISINEAVLGSARSTVVLPLAIAYGKFCLITRNKQNNFLQLAIATIPFPGGPIPRTLPEKELEYQDPDTNLMFDQNRSH